MVKKLIALVFLCMFFLSLASATFEMGNVSHNILDEYGISETLNGWVNMSFSDHPVNSLFETNKGQEISLIQILELDSNSEIDYFCSPIDCMFSYSASNGETSKTLKFNPSTPTPPTGNIIDMPGGFTSKILGVKFTGGIIDNINSFSMDISSFNSQSAYPALKIDIIDDEELEWQAYLATGTFGAQKNTCFESDIATEQSGITSLQYCQYINLSNAPNVKLGANVIDNSGGEIVEFKMSIESYDTYGSCNVNATGTGGIDCIAENFKIEDEKEYMVCIQVEDALDNNKYGIKYETHNPCGFSGSNQYDFDLFIRKGKYAGFPAFTLNNTELDTYGSNVNIGDYMLDYLDEKYNLDCSNECIVPIRFYSPIDDMSITFSNIDYAYMAGGLSKPNNNLIYDLDEDYSKVNSDFIQINLDDVGFNVVPEGSGSFVGGTDFILTCDGEEVFNQRITIQKSPEIKYVSPTSTASAMPTEFVVEVSSWDKEVVEYKWDFGDNTSIETTTQNKKSHIYSNSGTYDLTLTITDEEQLVSSKTFKIDVEIPSEAVSQMLTKKLADMENVQEDLDNLPVFYQTSLRPILEITQNKDALGVVELQYNNLGNDTAEQEYIDMMNALLSIKVPESLQKIEMAKSLTFPLDENKIDLSLLQEISGGQLLESEEKYVEEILRWNQEYLSSKVSLDIVSVKYEGVDMNVLEVFNFNINEKLNVPYSYYLILENLEGVVFEDSSLGTEGTGYVHIDLSRSNDITFSTTSEISFLNLEAFISPGINDLSIITNGTTPDPKKKKNVLIGFIIVLVVFIGLAAYLFLQKWYKHKYESHLFEDKNHLYNMANFINKSKKKGLGDKEIAGSLRGSKWSGEQVNYAMKKYAGKRTGMFEIPVDKLLKRKKEKEAKKRIEYRHPRGLPRRRPFRR